MSDLPLMILEGVSNLLIVIVLLVGIALFIFRNAEDCSSPSPCLTCKDISCRECRHLNLTQPSDQQQ